MSGFGLEKQPEPVPVGVPGSELATELSTILANALRAKRKVIRRVDVTKWVKPVDQLLKEYGKDQVVNAMEWYIANLDKEYTPQAYSAKTFRDKFPSILKMAGAPKLEAIPISQPAEEIAEHLQIKVWPKGSSLQLPTVVERSLQNYVQFLKDIHALQTRLLDDPAVSKDDLKLIRFARHLKDGLLHTPVNFATIWFLDVYDSVCRWPSWNGQLEPYVFSINHPRFENQMRQAAENYCGNPRRWDVLKQRIDNVSQTRKEKPQGAEEGGRKA